MRGIFLLSIYSGLLFTPFNKSDANHFGVGRVFELDFGDHMTKPLSPKQEREKSF